MHKNILLFHESFCFSVLFFVFAFLLRYIYRMSNHAHMLNVYQCLGKCEGIIFLIFQ